MTIEVTPNGPKIGLSKADMKLTVHFETNRYVVVSFVHFSLSPLLYSSQASFYPKPLLSEAEITRGCSYNGSHGCSSELNDWSFPLLQLFLRPALFPHHIPLSSSGMHFSLHSSLLSQFIFSIKVSILSTPRASFLPITKWVFLFLTIMKISNSSFSLFFFLPF